MNAFKAITALGLATALSAAVTASAADQTAASAPQVTRAQVKQELQQAIANGEIRHGDLVDFQALVDQSAQRTALADNHAKPAEVKTATAQTESRQPATSSGQ